MMSVIYASIMLLWFWGTSKKKAFYARKSIKLTNFLALMDAGDGKGKDHQNSMTIAQQNIALRASSTKLKRVRGAVSVPCILCRVKLEETELQAPVTGPPELHDGCAAEHRAAGFLHEVQARQRCPLGIWYPLSSGAGRNPFPGDWPRTIGDFRTHAEQKHALQVFLLSSGASRRHPACGQEDWRRNSSRKPPLLMQVSSHSPQLPPDQQAQLAEHRPRLPAGVGLYYGEEIHGVPPVLLQMVSRTPVLYEVNIFVTNRFVPIPEVMEGERLLVEQLGVSGFCHVIARCGHMPPMTPLCIAHAHMHGHCCSQKAIAADW